jgi:hypothetical protein
VGFSDTDLDFEALGVKSNWDVENTSGYTGGPWKVSIPAYSSTPYEINNVTQGVLYLQGDSNLPISDVTGVTYTLLDDSDAVVESSTTGALEVKRRGRVNFNDLALTDINQIISAGDKLYYNSTEYLIAELNDTGVWILDYDDGNASGITVQTRRRLIEGAIGYFGYRGLRLKTWSDHESEFGMINGHNPPPDDEQQDDSNFKENYLFLINNEFYKISEINGDEVVLAGRLQDWQTWDAGGTTVAYSLVHFPTKTVDVSFTVFDEINRNGSAPVIREILSSVDDTVAIIALSAPQSNGPEENIAQEEGITFTIQTRSGDTTEGEL